MNVRAIIKKYCEEEKRDFMKVCVVCAHMGGGISVTAFREGKIIDVSNPNEGGPFSTTVKIVPWLLLLEATSTNLLKPPETRKRL